MLNPSAIYTTSGQRFPVDSEIEVVMREKAHYKVGLGWTYRFKSGQEWVCYRLIGSTPSCLRTSRGSARQERRA